VNVPIDIREMDPETGSMATRIKRTYNLSAEAVSHVREMVGMPDLPKSQDGVVEQAIDALYRAVRDRDDAASWSSAAGSESFRGEMRAIASDLAAAEGWPAE
jgi:hypothetical protein